MSKLWEVIQSNVKTSASNNTADSLFANGLMQAKVIVSIKAILSDTGGEYQLTNAELASIKLINYYSKTELKGKWTYSTTENEFAHVLPRAGAPVDPIADGTQTISFWVSSTQIANENIAAQISQPKATIVTTAGGIFDSMVTLTAIQPITYTTSNTSFDREDTAEGTWRIQNGSTYRTFNWDQDNYYLSSRVYPFLKVDRYNVDLTGSTNPVSSATSMTDSFAYLEVSRVDDLSIFYMFDMGKEKTVTRGLYASIGTTKYHRTAVIKVNQQANALCLTRLRFYSGYSDWPKDWNANAWLTIYDLYGNRGHFSVKTVSENSLSISNRNVRSLAEATSIESKAKI